MNRALIVGVDSTIGSYLRQTLQEARWDVFATTRRREEVNERVFFLDLAHMILPLSVDIDTVFLCASITKIAQCQEDMARAILINQEAQITLAEHFLKAGKHVIFLSTNAVFDGRKPYYGINDIVSPMTIYGRCKAAVEHHLLAMRGLISIVRLSKVLTSNLVLMKKWLEALKNGLFIYPFSDLYVCPVSIKMVSHCLKMIAEKRLLGMIHLSGEKDITYYDLALSLAEHFNFSSHLIIPKSITNDINISAQGPYTSLDMQKSVRLFGLKDISLQAVLKDCY